MNRTSQPPVICFALGVIGLGVIAIVTGDFAEMGQTVAAWVPGRTALAYASGIVMVLGGIALTVNQTRALAVRVLLPFAILAWLSQAPTICPDAAGRGELGKHWRSHHHHERHLGRSSRRGPRSEKGRVSPSRPATAASVSRESSLDWRSSPSASHTSPISRTP